MSFRVSDRQLAQSRAAEVEFHGSLELMNPARWQVSGIPVMISDTTRIQGQPAPGAALFADDTVQAEIIIVLGANDPVNNAGEPTNTTLELASTDSLAAPTATITIVPLATPLPPTPTATAKLITPTPTEWVTPTPIPSFLACISGSIRDPDDEIGRYSESR